MPRRPRAGERNSPCPVDPQDSPFFEPRAPSRDDPSKPTQSTEACALDPMSQPPHQLRLPRRQSSEHMRELWWTGSSPASLDPVPVRRGTARRCFAVSPTRTWRTGAPTITLGPNSGSQGGRARCSLPSLQRSQRVILSIYRLGPFPERSFCPLPASDLRPKIGPFCPKIASDLWLNFRWSYFRSALALCGLEPRTYNGMVF
jgi:hypothetical protein